MQLEKIILITFSSMDLVKENRILWQKAMYIPDFDEIIKYLKERTIEGDIVFNLRCRNGY